MRLAYSISGYKSPNQFRWLLFALWHPNDLFVIHVDAKTSQLIFDQMRLIAQEVSFNIDNIIFIERERITWMGIGLVRAEIRAIKAILHQNEYFDYIINLSMQDYPLKQRDEIISELSIDPGRNYIRMLPITEQSFEVRRRPWLRCYEFDNRIIKTPLPNLMFGDISIRFKGSWWRVLSRPFCEWLVDAPETQRFLDFLEYVQAPDELFFQNIIMASPYRETIAKDYKHLIMWDNNSGSPNTITITQWDILSTSYMWYTRKVDETVDREVLERLAKQIGAPIPTAPMASPGPRISNARANCSVG